MLNETDFAEEADSCNVASPAAITLQQGGSGPQVFGRISEGDTTVTQGSGKAPDVAAQFGYGPNGSDPRGNPVWNWVPAAYSGDVPFGTETHDEYVTTFTAPAPGEYRYTYRFSLNGGAGWTYCDLNGAGSDPGATFELNQLPPMTITP